MIDSLLIAKFYNISGREELGTWDQVAHLSAEEDDQFHSHLTDGLVN